MVGAVKGDKYVGAKVVQDQIDSLDKTIARIDEEMDACEKDGYKVTAGKVAKYFVGFMTQFVSSMAITSMFVIPIGGVIAGGVPGAIASGAVAKRLGGTKGQQAKIAIAGGKAGFKAFAKGYLVTEAYITSILTPIIGGISTAAFLSDYRKSLSTWRKSLVEVRKDLVAKLKDAEKRAEQK